MKFTGRPRKLSDPEICAKYYELKDAVTVGFIAGCSETTVTAIVRRMGGAVQPRGGPITRPSKLSDAEICQRYLDGESGPAIATAAGTYCAHVYKTLDAAGVKRRERGWYHVRAAKHSSPR